MAVVRDITNRLQERPVERLASRCESIQRRSEVVQLSIGLADACMLLRELSDARCEIARIGISPQGVAIRLAAPPPQGVLPAGVEVIRHEHGRARTYRRVTHRGARIEWRAKL